MRDTRGFTVVELVIVLSMTALFSALVFSFAMNYWRYSALLEQDEATMVSRLNTSDFIRDNIGVSSGLITQNSVIDNNPGAVDMAAGNGHQYWEAVHAVPSELLPSANSIVPVLYFKKISTNKNGEVAMNGSQPYEDEFVLYLDSESKELRIRTLANTNVANNKATTSCPPQLSTTTCPADKVLSDKIKSVKTRYFSKSGNPIDYTSIVDPVTNNYIGPDMSAVEVLELTVNLTTKPFLQKTNATNNSTIIRIALRNT